MSAIQYDEVMDERVLRPVSVSHYELAVLLAVTANAAAQHDQCGDILDMCASICRRLGIPQAATVRPSLIMEALHA